MHPDTSDPCQAVFSNCRWDDGHRSVGKYGRQFVHEDVPSLGLLQKRERILFLPDFALVQDHVISAKPFELEFLESGGHAACVVAFLEDAEGQHEHRVALINGGEAVVAALIDVDNVVTEIHDAMIASLVGKREGVG